MKNKWRNLRDTFRKELIKVGGSKACTPGSQRAMIKKSRWTHFGSMLFLEETMKRLPNSSDPIGEDDSDDNIHFADCGLSNTSFIDENQIQTNIEKEKIERPTDSPIYEKWINEEESSSLLKIPKENFGEVVKVREITTPPKSKSKMEEDDSDYMFFMSLLPHLRNLSPLRNMHMRMKITELFIAEEEMKENNSQK